MVESMSQDYPLGNPRSKCADSVDDVKRIASKPLARSEGTRLREECLVVGDGRSWSKSWSKCIDEWEEWYKESDNTILEFRSNKGDIRTGKASNRFQPNQSRRWYAKLQDLERGLREDWLSDVPMFYTAMLTLTASNRNQDGSYKTPFEHLKELNRSWDSVRRELGRELEGKDWTYVAILEPHKSGYVHIHLAVFVKGAVSEEDFHSVIDKHLKYCPSAKKEAHDYDHDDPDERPISVRSVRERDKDESIGNLGAYLSSYIGDYEENPLDSSVRYKMFNTLLWATGKRRIRVSDKAQGYMAYESDGDDSDPDEEWELFGIKHGKDGELVEITDSSISHSYFGRIRHGDSSITDNRKKKSPPN